MENNTLFLKVQELHSQELSSGVIAKTIKTTKYEAEHIIKKSDPIFHPVVGAKKKKGDAEIGSEAYSFHNLKHVLLQIQHFKQAFNGFVAEMVILHKRNSFFTVHSYQQHQQKAQKLIDAGKLIALQLQEPFESLLISQVLGSILNTINKILSGEDEATRCCNTLYLGNRNRSLGFWQHAIYKDFFQPKF
jgi:hypothetical protein